MVLAEQNRALIEGRVDRLVHMHGGQIVEPEAGDLAENGAGAAR